MKNSITIIKIKFMEMKNLYRNLYFNSSQFYHFPIKDSRNLYKADSERIYLTSKEVEHFWKKCVSNLLMILIEDINPNLIFRQVNLKMYGNVMIIQVNTNGLVQ